jgi:hypothetical protein
VEKGGSQCETQAETADQQSRALLLCNMLAGEFCQHK